MLRKLSVLLAISHYLGGRTIHFTRAYGSLSEIDFSQEGESENENLPQDPSCGESLEHSDAAGQRRAKEARVPGATQHPFRDSRRESIVARVGGCATAVELLPLPFPGNGHPGLSSDLILLAIPEGRSLGEPASLERADRSVRKSPEAVSRRGDNPGSHHRGS